MMDLVLVQGNAYSNIKCAVVDKKMREEEKKSRIGQVKEGEISIVLQTEEGAITSHHSIVPHIDRGLL